MTPASDSAARGAGGGGRWAQLRAVTLGTPEGARNYTAGYRQACSYRQTMQVLNALRSRLGVTQQDLAVRMHRRQPTIARLLTRVQNPTLASVGEVLHGLGMRGRLVIEEARPGDDEALVVEVHVPSASAEAQPGVPGTRISRRRGPGTAGSSRRPASGSVESR